MFKIKKYLFKTASKYILINQLIILFLVIFLNFIELTRVLNNEDKSLLINEVIAENSSQRKATLV